MNILSIVILVLFAGYFLYVIIESLMIKKYRKSFKYVIHVNGIRGKSTTTRLIDSGFRSLGYKTFSKTTGTIATIINTDNKDVPIKRLGNANIREQIKMMKEAYKEKAEVIILECMAVNPELQKISEERILKADATLITNVREDHIMDMGENLDGIADALSNTIPTDGYLIVNPSKYTDFFKEKAQKKNTKVVISDEYKGEDHLDTFDENIALALALSKALSLDTSIFFEGMKKYHHDIGAFETIKLGDTIFLNGLSINDPESIKEMYTDLSKKYNQDDITIFLNNRNDRPTRVLQHIEMMKEMKCKKLIIFGSNPNYVKRKIEKERKDLPIEILKNIEDLKKEKIIYAIGNIGGKGMKVLEYFRKFGERI